MSTSRFTKDVVAYVILCVVAIMSLVSRGCSFSLGLALGFAVNILNSIQLTTRLGMMITAFIEIPLLEASPANVAAIAELLVLTDRAL